VGLAERRWLRLFTLCVLYVAQGIPWGFMAITIPAFLASKFNAGREEIATVVAMTSLAYACKWIWGPIVDAFTSSRFGRRRPWIVFAQAMMAATILAMIAIPDLRADIKILAWMVLVHSVFNSLQDVAVDALAVDLLDEAERARANGFMYASKYAGGFIGGAGLSWLLVRTSLETVLIVQTAILVAIMLLPLLVRERDRPPLPEATVPAPFGERFGAALGRGRAVLRSLAVVFSLRSTIAVAALMLGLNVSLGLLSTNAFTLFTQRLHWSQERYTDLVGGYGLVAGLVGALTGGFFADRFGRKRVIALATLVLAGGWALFGALPSLWDSTPFIYAQAIVEQLCYGILSVACFALCMDVAWSEIGASQFTAYMAMLNYSTTIGAKLAGTLSSHLSYASSYLAGAAFQVTLLLLLALVDPHETKRAKLTAGAPAPRRGIVALVILAAVFAGFTYYAIPRSPAPSRCDRLRDHVVELAPAAFDVQAFGEAYRASCPQMIDAQVACVLAAKDLDALAACRHVAPPPR
jgi:PAT family beta-lactamase induction signal transducer AmpG